MLSTNARIAWALLFFAAIGMMLADSPSDIELDARQYCRRVHSGAWPDFHRNYTRLCTQDGKVNRKNLRDN